MLCVTGHELNQERLNSPFSSMKFIFGIGNVFETQSIGNQMAP